MNSRQPPAYYKFRTALLAAKSSVFRRYYLRKVRERFDDAIADAADATLVLVIAELVSSTKPGWSMLMLSLLSAVPITVISTVPFVSDYFDPMPGGSIRDQIRLAESVLLKCFTTKALDTFEAITNSQLLTSGAASPRGSRPIGRTLDMADLTEAHQRVLGTWMTRFGPPEAITEHPERFAKKVAEEAEKGDPEAQYVLALCYSGGFGLVANPQSVLEWLERAAANEQPSAQCTLGYMRYLGFAAPQSQEVGMHWIRVAARNGSPEAQRALQVIEKAAGRAK